MAQNMEFSQRNFVTAENQPKDASEKYHRPAKNPPLQNPFHYQLFVSNESDFVFKKPIDVIYAYYGILKEASNMLGYVGGCGSIGYGAAPYEIAYQLLDPKVRSSISLNQFIQTFAGTGHVSLLKFYKLPADPVTEHKKHFMVEVELITGPKQTAEENSPNIPISYFAYYYGVVTVIQDEGGWHIHKIKYYPEDFLCAPYHSWFYDSKAMIQNVYINDLKLLQKIDQTAEANDVLLYYCSKGRQQYRLDYVRLTNGHEILLNESSRNPDGSYQEIQLIGNGWEDLKLSPEL